MDDILAKHRKEAKELMGKITGLKKQAKGDNKRKKQIMEDIETLENELVAKHKAEIEALNVESVLEHMEHVAVGLQTPVEPVEKKKSKQQARKDKKEAEFEAVKKQLEEEASQLPDLNAIELNAIGRALEPVGLAIKQITADGHCLYNALADQLNLHDPSGAKNYKQLREIASDFMIKHPDDFMPFLTKEDGDMFTLQDYQDYCHTLKTEAVWGGNLEIQALSQALQKQIQIYQNGPVLTIGESLGSPLFVSFHRHAYGLGCHYNSLVPS